MIRISNIKYAVNEEVDINKLTNKAAKILKVKPKKIKNIKISKKAIDARKKCIYYVFNVDIEIDNEQKYANIPNVSYIKPFEFAIPKKTSNIRPLVVGFGPAGMMAGLILAKAGLNPIIIERGKNVDERQKDVNTFWEKGILNEDSNVQFGEGGAGTFSDGKLTTGIKDYRCQIVLNEFVKAGAPEEILYISKPHIGTDNLVKMVKNIRKSIISLGGEIRFENKLIDILIKDNKAVGAKIKNKNEIYDLEIDNILLAIGHSARDTFEMLNNINIGIQQKAFAVGVRIEHSQYLINNVQYGDFKNYLPPADYKIAVHLKNGRSAYTFCMCPGGVVVGAASEKGHIVTNGMSYYSRSGSNANSALLIGVYPYDFGSEHPLAGVEFQRRLEKISFINGGSNYNAPIQKVGDFINNIKTCEIGNIVPTYRPGVTYSNLNNFLPEFITDSLKLGIIEMDKKIKGFSDNDAILTAVETRSSSPIRIPRNENNISLIKGIIPCGEGCGYAGGIISAAVDGIKCAETIINI